MSKPEIKITITKSEGWRADIDFCVASAYMLVLVLMLPAIRES